MDAALRAVLAIAIMALLASQAIAQSRAEADPDWPCRQIKVQSYSLAGVWSGPKLDLNSQSWRDESDIADLARRFKICRGNDPKFSMASNVLAANSAPWPIVSARRTGLFKSQRTRTRACRRCPAPTAKSSCGGTYASSTIAARQSLTSARPRRSLNSASERSRAPCKRLSSDFVRGGPPALSNSPRIQR